MAFSYSEGMAFYVPVPANKDEATEIVQEFKYVLEDKNILKIGLLDQ